MKPTACGGTEARENLAQLAQDHQEFGREDRVRLLRGLAETYYRIGDTSEAERLWMEVAREQPNDLRLRLLLFDLALDSGNDATMKRLLGEIQGIEGEG